jgi:GNAT superfamily N-acetyltransferase
MRRNARESEGKAIVTLRDCTAGDVDAIESIINSAALAYEGVIPADCWHQPYMSRQELLGELAAGVRFRGWDERGTLRGVMGIQNVRDATLILHAYVEPAFQSKGIGGELLSSFRAEVDGLLLVGTWAAASWAIRFYERHGFRLVPIDEADGLLRTYWSITPLQRERSVVLRAQER